MREVDVYIETTGEMAVAVEGGAEGVAMIVVDGGGADDGLADDEGGGGGADEDGGGGGGGGEEDEMIVLVTTDVDSMIVLSKVEYSEADSVGTIVA